MSRSSTLDKLVWQFSGADVQLLQFSGSDSRQRFRIIGIASIIIIAITFLAISNSLIQIFDAFWIPLIGAIVLTFLIISIYRLNMLSLEPASLPVETSEGSLAAPFIIRITVITLFAIFVAKQFEFLCFSGLISAEDLQNLSINKKYIGQGDEQFMEKMFVLNTKYWFVWSMTAATVYLFLFPINVKYKLRRNEQEYYRKKSVLEQELVELNYSEFKTLYKKSFENKRFTKRSLPIEFNDAQFLNPPFNSKRKPKEVSKSESEFLELFK